MKLLQRALLSCLLAVAVTGPVGAAPKISEVTQTYSVGATTATALKREMRRKGPKGFWGLTRWDIRWTPTCKVTARIVYTLPRHENPGAMSPTLRRAFERMVANLAAHERLHGEHGKRAAIEIDRAGCRGALAIIRKYNEADRILDRRTQHGATQGVQLRSGPEQPADRELR